MLNAAAIAPETIRRLTRAEYDRMVEIGLLEGERVELLEGFIVTMSPQGTAHADAIRRLNMLLVRMLADVALVQVQLPLAVSDDSEPAPDLSDIPFGDYTRDHPHHALLVIEVANSSLNKDRLTKGALYAAAGVPEYWVINLVEHVIEVHTDPAGREYRSMVTCGWPWTTCSSPDALPV